MGACEETYRLARYQASSSALRASRMRRGRSSHHPQRLAFVQFPLQSSIALRLRLDRLTLPITTSARMSFCALQRGASLHIARASIAASGSLLQLLP
jgi:hypothetical protein